MHQISLLLIHRAYLISYSVLVGVAALVFQQVHSWFLVREGMFRPLKKVSTGKDAPRDAVNRTKVQSSREARVKEGF